MKDTCKSSVCASNWMSAVDGKTPITAVNMPGTHDSASRYAFPFNMISRTQSESILGQLYSGVRYFDMRFELKKDGQLIAVHGITDCKSSFGFAAKGLSAEEAVRDCLTFLKANPGETVLFQLKEENRSAGKSFYTEFFDHCIKPHEDMWFLENRVPTLGEVRGKIVLLNTLGVDTEKFSDADSGINFRNYPYMGSKDPSDFRCCDISTHSGQTYTQMYVQDSYRLGRKGKWEAVTKFLKSELKPSDFNMCYVSCIGAGTPFINSEVINRKLKGFDFIAGKPYGIIALDFAERELCEKIYMTNRHIMNCTPEKPTEYTDSSSYAFMGRTLELLRNAVEKLFSLIAGFMK